jgi:hypothetical protein
VYRLLNPLGFVAFKMCRRSGLGRMVRVASGVKRRGRGYPNASADNNERQSQGGRRDCLSSKPLKAQAKAAKLLHRHL